jgi:nucleotide-binding universal stress UspA family protein
MPLDPPGGLALLEEVRRASGMGERDVTLCLTRGPVAERLTELAHDVGAAALVIASRGHGPLRRALLGSTSGALAACARTPLVIVPDATRRPGSESATPAR